MGLLYSKGIVEPPRLELKDVFNRELKLLSLFGFIAEEELQQIDQFVDFRKHLSPLNKDERKNLMPLHERLMREAYKGKIAELKYGIDMINTMRSIEYLMPVMSYDCSKLSGPIHYRKGYDWEEGTLLDGSKRSLKGIPVLAHKKGVFGGPYLTNQAPVDESTRNILTIILSFTGLKTLNENLVSLEKLYEEHTNLVTQEMRILSGFPCWFGTTPKCDGYIELTHINNPYF